MGVPGSALLSSNTNTWQALQVCTGHSAQRECFLPQVPLPQALQAPLIVGETEAERGNWLNPGLPLSVKPKVPPKREPQETEGKAVLLPAEQMWESHPLTRDVGVGCLLLLEQESVYTSPQSTEDGTPLRR